MLTRIPFAKSFLQKSQKAPQGRLSDIAPNNYVPDIHNHPDGKFSIFCPILQANTKNWIKAPCNHAFDFKALSDCFRTKGILFTEKELPCPCCKDKFHLKDAIEHTTGIDSGKISSIKAIVTAKISRYIETNFPNKNIIKRKAEELVKSTNYSHIYRSITHYSPDKMEALVQFCTDFTISEFAKYLSVHLMKSTQSDWKSKFLSAYATLLAEEILFAALKPILSLEVSAAIRSHFNSKVFQ